MRNRKSVDDFGEQSMRKAIRNILIFLMAIFMLAACSKSNSAWQEQYDLGMRFLTEGNYEEAIVALQKAIELDPKQADAYISLADAYAGNSDYELAVQTIQDAVAVLGDAQELQDKLQELLEELQRMQQAEMEPETKPEETVPEEITAAEVTEVKNGVIWPGSLSISDFSWEFQPSEDGGTSNRNRVGYITLHFNVNGPEDIKNVRIDTWGTDCRILCDLQEQFAMMEEIWGEDWESDSIHNRDVPFTVNTAFPVYEEDSGTTVDVLLDGLNADGKIVSHCFVTVDIP